MYIKFISAISSVYFWCMIFILSFNINSIESQLEFSWCCEIGRRSAINSRLCVDYTSLNGYNPNGACKFAFTICCNQYNKNEECERGKSFAFQQESCFDSSRTQYSSCDSFTDCCNCCQLGIQFSKNNETCEIKSSLSVLCNKIQIECCTSTQSDDIIVKQTLGKDEGKPNESGGCQISKPCPNGQICQEMRNGPTCVCAFGYEMDARINSCVDIDECKQLDACPSGSLCENLIGSYKCIRTCQPGYIYDHPTSKCKDINECAMNIHKCAKGMRCENIPGSYRCIRDVPCGTGYSVDSLTQECIDIDECTLNLHDCQPGFECVNMFGSYQCRPQECQIGYLFNFNIGRCEPIKCNPGYINHNKTGECVDINECDFTENPCQLSEKCVNTRGSFNCVQLLTCEKGFELDSTKSECIDIDECFIRKHTCPSNASCENRYGGFTCHCPKGFELDLTGTRCEDIDECTYGSNCPRNSKCVNSVGSYECRCNPGLELIKTEDVIYCQDIDECKSKFICEHKCVNTFGSFQCLCREGYNLAQDKRSCKDIDECQINKALCMGQCVNTPGSFECSCGAGFELDKAFRRYCNDIDECRLGTHNCHHQERCVNVRGSFKCINITCPAGYFLAGGSQSTRCERTNSICGSQDTECYRRPMKIFYHYITFTRKVAVPVRILKTASDYITSQRTNAITTRYEMKFISSTNTNQRESLSKDDFILQYPGSQNRFDGVVELLLIRQAPEAQEVRIEIRVETYYNSQFTRSILNRVFLL